MGGNVAPVTTPEEMARGYAQGRWVGDAKVKRQRSEMDFLAGYRRGLEEAACDADYAQCDRLAERIRAKAGEG